MGILDQLGIEPGALLVNIVGFILLFLLLRKFAFGPISNLLSARAQKVAEDVQQAADARQEADAHLASIQERREELLAEVDTEADQARKRAQHEVQRLLEEARARARERELHAEKNIAAQTERAIQELRADVTGLAVGFSERLLAQSLDTERHQALVDKFIEDVEKMAAEEGQT